MYCTGTGWSRRYCARICSITAGSRSSPAITSAGSPGNSCCSEKISTDTKNSVGINCIRRRARKLSMGHVPLTPLSFPGRSAARRSSRRGALQSRGRYERGVWYGPGSAQRHEECRSASGTRESCPSLQLQPDHAHQAIGHLLVAFEPGRMRDQKLAMIEIDERLVVEHDL